MSGGKPANRYGREVAESDIHSKQVSLGGLLTVAIVPKDFVVP